MATWKYTTGIQGADMVNSHEYQRNWEQGEEKKKNISRCALTDHTRRKNLENQYSTLK